MNNKKVEKSLYSKTDFFEIGVVFFVMILSYFGGIISIEGAVGIIGLFIIAKICIKIIEVLE